MGMDEVILLLCATLWVLHALRLVRHSPARTWPALVIVLCGLAASIGCWWVLPDYAASVSTVLVVGLLVVPVVATRAASRALRWGYGGRARAWAAIALVLRPLATQRRFRRAIEISERLDGGEDVDIDEAVLSLGKLSEAQRSVHRIAFLSWSNDFASIAHELEDAEVRGLVMRSGMAGIVTTVVGETGSDQQLVDQYRQLTKLRSLAKRTLDGTLALVATAAYAGAWELVRGQIEALSVDVHPSRLAFMLATALQRARRQDEAAEVIAEALARPGLSVSNRRRLLHRRHNVLDPIAAGPEVDRLVSDVSAKLRARRTLSALGLGWRQPAPLTWLVSLSLCGVYAWQVGQRKSVVFADWGLMSPFAVAPDLWRLLSYACLHIDMGHLVVNLVGLLLFGRFVERHFGVLSLILVYLAGALAGGGAYLLFASSYGVAIGASGAVLALFGATVARVALDVPLRRSPQGKRELLFLVTIAVVQLVVDGVWAQTSGSAHAGGLVAGMALGALLTLLPLRRRGRKS